MRGESLYESRIFRNSPGVLVASPSITQQRREKRSVIPTNTQFLAAFRATERVARQNPKDPESNGKAA
jgi:hypothetical protein